MSDIAKIILERYGSEEKKKKQEEESDPVSSDLEKVIKDFFEYGQKGDFKEAAQCFMVACELCEEEEGPEEDDSISHL